MLLINSHSNSSYLPARQITCLHLLIQQRPDLAPLVVILIPLFIRQEPLLQAEPVFISDFFPRRNVDLKTSCLEDVVEV